MSKKAGLVGRNLARMRYSQQYFSMVMQMITALGILTIALGLSPGQFFGVVFFGLVFYWLFGYFIDKNNIRKADQSQDFLQVKQQWKTMLLEVWHEIKDEKKMSELQK
ncbi:hypothetical protein LCGC14_0303130 [marine sediment metagenome]|uniref:Uncharacterized protein n=1 Tax=marine sediment metagenome TaxID=412755 RepID=A0A0F9U6U4_9ZZZZ